jgi:ribonuclease P protein component
LNLSGRAVECPSHQLGPADIQTGNRIDRHITHITDKISRLLQMLEMLFIVPHAFLTLKFLGNRENFPLDIFLQFLNV